MPQMTTPAFAQRLAEVAETVRERAGIPSLNAMQQGMVAACGGHRHVVLVAPTGSGKTLAYVIPLLAMLCPQQRGVQALVVLPTRELARQVYNVVCSLSVGVKAVCCHGGHSFADEAASLAGGATVVVGTPGRLADHLQRGTLLLTGVVACVVDEYDKCLELGFRDEVEALVTALPGDGLRILTSATNATDIPSYMSLDDAAVLHYDAAALQDEVAARLAVYAVPSADADKKTTLWQLLCCLQDAPTLIFCNNREAVDEVAAYLHKKGTVCVAFHGGMPQPDRERSLCRFANGSAYICVATDLAARGLDIAGVEHVIHYHLPVDAEAYIHRNGRTARMNAGGSAYLIVGEGEQIPACAGVLPSLQPQPRHVPAVPPMETLHFAAGKREKLGKGDILGFLTRCCSVPSAAVGVIDVKDHYAYAAIGRDYVAAVLQIAAGEKIKGKRVRVSRAR